MALEILRDPRIRAIDYKDLLQLSRFEIFKEITLSLPWLATSLALATMGWIIPALGFSFIFFLCGLRQVHNAYHYAVGIPRAATEWMMFVLSIAMQSSMHALQLTHLHHHKHCMDEDDTEAASARMPGWKAIVFGPMFYVNIQTKGWSLASPRQRIWIASELVGIVLWVTASLLIFDIPALKYHVLAMTVGQCLTAFFAVWTVHHGCDRSHFIARTIRNPVKSLIVFDMFYHLEHHLFPRVPTCKLGALSHRIDAAAPELSSYQVY